MRIFAIRHGQVLPQRYFGSVLFPVGDEPITALGRYQARLAGARLRELGFKGIIFASPYDRTMETASIVSEELGIGFTPLPCLREMFVTNNASRDFCGLRPEEIKPKFPRAELLYPITYPWWEIKQDTVPDVVERLRDGLKPVLEALPKDSDVLLVGHAATLVGLREVFQPANYKSSVMWNCCINLLYSSDGETYVHDADFINEKIRTANYMTHSENLEKFQGALSAAAEFAKSGKGELVMHIGDTHSANYAHYEMLIEAVKPDVIIHTGDFADELKAGRVEKARADWKNTVPRLLNIMKKSGAKLIAVVGNNDLESELHTMAPELEIQLRNTVVELSGKRVCLGHEVLKIDPGVTADAHLYGHGLTGEERTPEDNVRGGSRYFNAYWGPSLHFFGEDKHLILPKPEL